MAAAHEDQGELVPEAPVIGVFGAVVQVHGVQPAQGVEVAAAQEDHRALDRAVGFLHGVLGEIKQGLGHRRQDLFE